MPVAAMPDALPRAPRVSLLLDGCGSGSGDMLRRCASSIMNAELEAAVPQSNEMTTLGRIGPEPPESPCAERLFRTQSYGASSRLERHKLNYQRKLDRDCDELKSKIERVASRGQSINHARQRKRESIMSKAPPMRGQREPVPEQILEDDA